MTATPNGAAKRLTIPIRQRFSDLAIDSEAMVVAAIVYKPEFAKKYANHITPELFYERTWRVIVETALPQIRDYGEVCAVLISKAIAERTDVSIDQVIETLDCLWEWGAFAEPRVLQALNYLHSTHKRLQMQSGLRSLVHESDCDILSNDDLASSLESLAADSRDNFINQSVTLGDDIIDPANLTTDTIKTGLHWFDSAMAYGAIFKGETICLTAPPKVGKSALALQLTLCALKFNLELNAVWCLGEMSIQQLQTRALSVVSGLSSEMLRRGPEQLTPESIGKKKDGMDWLHELGQ